MLSLLEVQTYLSVFNPHQDAGIAIRHSRGGILFYTAGSRNELEGVDTGGPGHTRKLYPRKRHVFAIGKYVEDVKQK